MYYFNVTCCLLYFRLKFFKAGHDEGLKYRGGRDYEALKSYIGEQVGKAQQEVDDPQLQEEPKAPSPVSGLVELTEETFDNYIATGNHFVKFYAPWCGYCKVCTCPFVYFILSQK